MAEALDLGAALDTVVATLAAAFPTFKTVAAEDESRKTLEVPAIVVQMSELEPDPDKDSHTGQFPCLVRIEARIILGYRTPNVRREVIKAAGALAAAVHNERLGVAWGAAVVLAVEPDDFAPQADQFDIWRVEWAHAADIGPSFFIDDGLTPTQLLTSWSPDIGPAHEDDYVAEAGGV